MPMSDSVARYALNAGVRSTGFRFLERREASEGRIQERIAKAQTTLLREFRKLALTTEMRLRTNEFSVSGLTERMAMLETRMSDLERK
jgi:hypothetical protein